MNGKVYKIVAAINSNPINNWEKKQTRDICDISQFKKHKRNKSFCL